MQHQSGTWATCRNPASVVADRGASWSRPEEGILNVIRCSDASRTIQATIVPGTASGLRTGRYRLLVRFAAALTLAAVCAVAIAACVSGTGTVSTAIPASPVAGGGSESSPAVTPPGMTETSWGRIWDGLPPSFPHYPGVEPTETGEGPASAVLDVPGKATTAADWYAKALKQAGYSTEARSGPLENGSIVIASVGSEPGCRVQTSLVPSGGRTIATILFAAACPYR